MRGRAVIPGYLSGALRQLPLIPAYQWRTRAYPTARRAIRKAEAEHGPPVPTCLCGGRVLFGTGHNDIPSGAGRCQSCGATP